MSNYEIHDNIVPQKFGAIRHELETLLLQLIEEGADLERVIDVKIDPEQWRQEVERVLPSLRIAVRHDHRVRPWTMPTYLRAIIATVPSPPHHIQDWRVHYDQMHHYHDGITSYLVDTKVYTLYYAHVHLRLI